MKMMIGPVISRAIEEIVEDYGVKHRVIRRCSCGGVFDYLYHVWYRCRSCGAHRSWVPKP